MLIIKLLILSLILVGCATVSSKPILYAPYKEKVGGFIDSKESTVFIGNTSTAKDEAALYTVIRSIEVCKKRGFKGARIIKYLSSIIEIDKF